MRDNIFISRPRCASRTIKQAVKRFPATTIETSVLGLSDFIQPRSWEVANKFVWTITRNPYERVISTYNHSLAQGWINSDSSFLDFVSFGYGIWAGFGNNSPMNALYLRLVNKDPEIVDLYEHFRVHRDRLFSKPDNDTCLTVWNHMLPWNRSILVDLHRDKFNTTTRKAVEAAMQPPFDTYPPVSEVPHSPRQLNFVLRVERLNEDYMHLKRLIGIDDQFTVGHIGKTANSKTKYDHETWGMVSKMHDYEIRTFNYRAPE